MDNIIQSSINKIKKFAQNIIQPVANQFNWSMQQQGIRTPQQFVQKAAQIPQATFQSLQAPAKALAVPYAQQRIIEPAKSTVQNLQQMFAPGKTMGQRAMNLGTAGIGGLQTLWGVSGGGIPWFLKDAYQSGAVAKREGKPVLPAMGRGFTGQEYKTLGEAVSADPRLQKAVNVGELAYYFGPGIYRLGKSGYSAVKSRLMGTPAINASVWDEAVQRWKTNQGSIEELDLARTAITKVGYKVLGIEKTDKIIKKQGYDKLIEMVQPKLAKKINYYEGEGYRKGFVETKSPVQGGVPRGGEKIKVTQEGKIKVKGIPGKVNVPEMKLPTAPTPPSPPTPDEELITKLTTGLKTAERLRGTQEQLYTKARGVKLAKMIKAREKMAGEEGFYEELGTLKGQLPKVEYESVRQLFKQEETDRLFNMIKKSKTLNEWEKINAQIGLEKIMGEKGVGVPQKAEIEKLYRVFGKDFTDTLLSKRSTFEKLQEAGMQLYNLPRSMMAGVGDFSATLMQNIMFAYRHPITTTRNLIKSVKMFGSERFYKASMEEIGTRPNSQLYKDAKLAITDVSPIMSQREEQFMSSWAERIPGLGKIVRATGRSWTGFLNKMRADVFDQLVNSQKHLGLDPNDAKFLKDAGEFVNAGTGRGSLGSLERSAPILSQGLFSARKLMATIKFLDPRLYLTSSPVVRKEALKTVAAFVGGGVTILTLAEMAGAEVGKDPTSTDFGKIKIGNTRFNVFGTYQQIAVLMARLFKGYATSSTTGKRMILGDETAWRPLNRFDLITRFFESKEHPTLSLIIAALRGQTNLGQPFELAPELLSRFIPMVLGDSYDLYKEHGAVGLIGSIPMIFGIPTQTYGKEYATQELTPAGKPKVRLKPETDLAKDVVLGITGQEKSNIPEAEQQQLVPQLQQERQQKIEQEQLKRDLQTGVSPTVIPQDIKSQKMMFEYSPETIKQVGNVVLYKENDKVKEIDLSFFPTRPNLTGQVELDKKASGIQESVVSPEAEVVLDKK